MNEQTESMVPNLDALPQDELMRFWNHYQNGRNFRTLFPDGGRGTKAAASNLANYASNKAAAILCREQGTIESALVYEGICDRIYNKLPGWARGW